MPSLESALQSAAEQTTFESVRKGIRDSGGAGSALQVYQMGFFGAFGPTGPEWMKKIWEEDQDLVGQFRGLEHVAIPRAEWRGKRATFWNHYMELQPADALRGNQDTGNCTSWSGRAMLNCCLGADIKKRLERQKWPGARIGTAMMYANRGHSGAGMTLARAIDAVANKYGISIQKSYCNGQYDLTAEDADEGYGVSWWRGVPDCVLEETRQHKLLAWDRVTDEDKSMSYLLDGRFLFHGSQYTARPSGNLISSLQSIGGHAQAVLGYDDTDEFKQWYKENTGQTLNDYVVIHDQSWGNWNQIPGSKWPDHLWGQKPEGAWVVTGRDYMRIVNQWGDQYAALDVGGFPDDSPPPPPPPPPATWLAVAVWDVSPTTGVVGQIIEWFVNGEKKATVSMNASQERTTSDDAKISESLKAGDAVEVRIKAITASGVTSEPAIAQGTVEENGERPLPPRNVRLAFTKR